MDRPEERRARRARGAGLLRIVRLVCAAAAIGAAIAANSGARPLSPPHAGMREDPLLRRAAEIENSLVRLVRKVRASTVAVVRYLEAKEPSADIDRYGGVGSGVVVSREGKVFTNVHVVKDAKRLVVVLPGGEVVDAELFNEMPAYDFALLRVRGGGMEIADFADTDRVRPGQWVLAAGNPRGLALDGEPLVSLGIVSAKGRVAGARFRYHNSVQTDAEINPGNSGGPLFDLDGRVVGINGLISTRDGRRANVGVGFAIAADQIRRFLPALLTGRPVTKGFHGIVPARRDDGGRGVAVRSVKKGSPAAKVGIRPGDRIVGIDGEPIDDLTDWARAEAMLPPGYTATFRVWRNGRVQTKRIKLEWAPLERDNGR